MACSTLRVLVSSAFALMFQPLQPDLIFTSIFLSMGLYTEKQLKGSHQRHK